MSRGSLMLMLNELMGALQREEQEKESLRVEVQRIRSLSPVPGLMTADQLLFAIGASTLIQQSTEDIEKVLRFRSSMHPIAEGEATSLLRTDRFLDWIQPGRSDALLIDGAGGAIEFVDHVERVSAKSVICASLLATLGRSQPKTIQLFFFCGLHSSEKDPLSDGPRGLMRSLLCELVKETHHRDWLHLDFINDRRYRDGLQNQSLGFMCDAFYRILQRLQMQDALDLSVYCVVDGIGQYEQQRWYDDLVIVIKMFLRILNDTQLKPVFKLLLTGPQRVRYVHDLLGLPANRRLRANPVIASGGPASFGLLSGAEQILQGRRQQMVAERRGRSQYFDDVEFTADDYE
ncbi:hypothetical protein FDECE_7769 [Fusarium decemcellulare]|nr:hypothetical protein FDECE_7769 [Fusarium decemcellulare]